jgi:hypothetical protein
MSRSRKTTNAPAVDNLVADLLDRPEADAAASQKALAAQLGAEGFVSWEGAARFTSLSVATLKRLVRKGKLRAFRPSAKRTLLSVRELRQYIEANALSGATS